MFRQAALNARNSDWLSVIDLATPLPYRILASASLIFIAALMLLLVFGSYTHRERARGILAPRAGLLAVRTTTDGTIAHTLVQEGDVVEKDQPLIELSADLDSISIGKTRAAISSDLDVQKKRLEGDLKHKQDLASERTAWVRRRIDILQQQLSQIDSQIAIQGDQVKSAQALLNKITPLGGRGVVSGMQIDQQKAVVLAAQSELINLRRQRSDSEQQIALLKEQMARVQPELAIETNEILRKRTEIDQLIAQNESQRAVVLRAPEGGIVANIVSKDGDYSPKGSRLLSIIPNGSDLQAELWLPSRAVGFVSKGDRVALRYDAYAYQEFGVHYGTVTDVSRSAADPNELRDSHALVANEPMYRIIVKLDNQAISVHGKAENLRPGMALTGDIMLYDKKVLEWLLGPIRSAKSQ